MTSVLIVEASATRQHVLKRVLGARFPELLHCATPELCIDHLEVGDTTAPGALVLGLEALPQPRTDDLLAILRAPRHERMAVLVLAHTTEPALVDWAARRPHSAILLWEDFTDSADCLDMLLAAPSAEDEPAAPEGDPIRVLFVDDSRTVRASYTRLIAGEGYHVETATSAAEAMEKACAEPFDIAIIDYFMPGENGDSLCRRLRAEPRTAGLTSAILTGTYLDQVIQDSLRAGAVECMFKNEVQELFLARLAAMSRAVRARKSVEAERSRLSGILGSVGDGVYGVSRAGLITFINPAACRILGYPPELPLIGASAHRLFHHSYENGDPSPEEGCRLRKAYASGESLQAWATVFWRRDGGVVPVECTVYPLRIDGRQEGSVVAFRDVSERRAMEQELFWQANHDPLTKLYNRRHFEQQLEEEAERCRRGGESALLYLDLDRFKYINDTAGHAAGDQLLVEISQQMRERLRESDLLARLGGDEFAIILRTVNGDQVLQVAESFREILERYTFVYGGSQYRIYGSIGVAHIDRSTTSAGEILANADIACHIAKNKGRNQTHIYQPDSDAKHAMNVDLGWSTRLQTALKDDGFRLYYQPIVPLGGLDPETLPLAGEAFPELCNASMQKMLYCEALVRLDDETGLIQPNVFLQTAERFGLMPQIDLWVLRHAIADLAAAQRQGRRASVSVNLSGHSLVDERFVPEAVRLLAEHNVDPHSLIFEITETNAIANMDAAQRLIHALHAHGCRFALDDFGSGFSSFHHLKHLPVDIVKIDGQFVRGMAREPADRAIVMSINDIAHSFGKRTVAEYVESREVLELLCRAGVDYAQGDYLSAARADVLLQSPEKIRA